MSSRNDPIPVVDDQFTAARIYFGSLMGMILIESALVMPQYIMSLIRKDYIKKAGRHSKIMVLYHNLVTLPSPVPFLTQHNYPMYFRFLIFAGLNILFGYNRVRFTSDFTLYGWLTVANGGMAFLLSPRGCNLLSLLLRVPTPLLLTYHRWCGFGAMVHATVHFGTTARHNIGTGQFLRALQTSQLYAAGLAAWLGLALLFITSIRPIRRRFFELFYYPHYFFFVFAIAAMVHAKHAKEFFLPGMILWALDRLWRLRQFFMSAKVQSVEYLVGGVTKITVAGVAPKAPGQIAWVQFPDVSNIVWHPFTVASSPSQGVAVFAIRGLGGFTKALNSLGSLDEKNGSGSGSGSIAPGSTLRMRLDGPHGVGGIKWGVHPITALVAGGIGITPGISIASHIVNTAVSPASPYSSPNAGVRHIHLLWILKDLSHASWFAEELSSLATLAESSNGKVTFDITIHYTSGGGSGSNAGKAPIQTDNGSAMELADRSGLAGREESLTSAFKGYSGPGTLVQGRPDIAAWFGRIREIRGGGDVAVNLCGPRMMIDSARKAAAKTSWEGGLFEVEEEVFEY